MKRFYKLIQCRYQYVDIKYVLHHVLQYFNVYSMYIQYIFNIHSMYIQCTFNISVIWLMQTHFLTPSHTPNLEMLSHLKNRVA